MRCPKKFHPQITSRIPWSTMCIVSQKSRGEAKCCLRTRFCKCESHPADVVGCNLGTLLRAGFSRLTSKRLLSGPRRWENSRGRIFQEVWWSIMKFCEKWCWIFFRCAIIESYRTKSIPPRSTTKTPRSTTKTPKVNHQTKPLTLMIRSHIFLHGQLA